jgi:hypothetical protein
MSQIESNPFVSKGLTSSQHDPKSRLDESSPVYSNPSGATERATNPILNDPALAVVTDAWPELPQSIRASIVTIVKVAAKADAGR